MHEVVRLVMASKGEGSFDSVPTSIPVALSTSCSGTPLGDEQLKRIFEKLTTLYEELKPRLLRFVQARISSRLQGRIDVEDVLHSALLRLMKCLRSKTPASDDQLRSWLYKKVWSELQDEIRKCSTEGRNVEREFPLPEESVADMVKRLGLSTNLGLKDVIELIRQALKPIEFEILRLRFQDELSYEDIATIFDTTAEAVRKRCVRTLLKVRETIPDPFASSGPARG